MTSNYDDFPEALIPKAESKPKRKTFSFGDDEDDGSDNQPLSAAQEPERAAEDDEPPAEIPDLPTASEPPVEARYLAPPVSKEPVLDRLLLQTAALNVLDDPALRRITEINQSRFSRASSAGNEFSRVTRGWLNGLDQRDFFLALAYPGHHLASLLNGHATLRQIRMWVNGLEGCPDILRRLLTVEHLLDRRTLNNRERMPTRQQIEQALRAMPKAGDVAEVLGGFDSARPASDEIDLQPLETTEEIASHLRIVSPDDHVANERRQGSSLPVNPRLRGKGRPLGQRLLKPNSYCYNLSKKSIDGSGVAQISVEQAVNLINKVADLENQYGIHYSLRRKDRNSPWTLNNIEFLPSEELERQRSTNRES